MVKFSQVYWVGNIVLDFTMAGLTLTTSFSEYDTCSVYTILSFQRSLLCINNNCNRHISYKNNTSNSHRNKDSNIYNDNIINKIDNENNSNKLVEQ